MLDYEEKLTDAGSNNFKMTEKIRSLTLEIKELQRKIQDSDRRNKLQPSSSKEIISSSTSIAKDDEALFAKLKTLKRSNEQEIKELKQKLESTSAELHELADSSFKKDREIYYLNQ